MGLISKKTLLFSSSLLLLASPLLAVPRLRLSTTVAGPISATQGTSPASVTVEAYAPSNGESNADNETANLRITLSSTASWVSATAGARRGCRQREGDCIPITLAFASQSLAVGRYSATVSVADPNAIDAPQNILVILNVGGGVPATVNMYLPTNGDTEEIDFYTGSGINTDNVVTTQSGGGWLALFSASAGSFDFMRTYRIRATSKPESPLAQGTYRGTVTVAGSTVAAENKQIAVNLNVTSQPIAFANPDRLRARLTTNAPDQVMRISVGNRGLGKLTVSGASATAENSGTWLKAELVANTSLIIVTFSSKGVNAGIYRGSVSITSNAANNPISVPVELEVIAPGAPALRYQGVQDNATFTEGDVLAAGGIVAAFGEQFTYNAASQASSLPLPTELDGVSVYVNDKPAPVYYVSYNQVNFQIPYDVSPGAGTVRIDRGGQRGATISVRINPAVPKLLRLNLRSSGIDIPEPQDYYAIAVNSDGTISLPKSLGIPNTRPSRVGETIVIYGLGFGQVSPPVQSGAAVPATPLPSVPSAQKTVFFGALALGTGATQEAQYVGLTPGLVGLYQINVVVPPDSPKGDVPVRVQLDTVASEYGYIAVE